MNTKTDTIDTKFNWKTTWSFLQRNLIIIGIVLLAIYVAIVEPQFATGQNFQNIVKQFGVLSLTAIGMTFVIIAGYIDLSIVGMFSFVGVVTVALIPVVGEIPAMLISMALGTFCGFLDAAILAFVGARNDADAVFVTFGMSTVFFAIALTISGGSTLRLPVNSPIFTFIGTKQLLFLPISFYIFLIALAIAHIFLMKTKTGREIRLTGGNRAAARLAGISSPKSTIIAYSLLGLTVGLGTIIYAARNTLAGPMAGTGMETNSILAVVIGGTRLKGGLGSVLRTFIGVLLVVIMENALNLIGVPTTLRDVFKGAILMLAIWLDYRRQ